MLYGNFVEFCQSIRLWHPFVDEKYVQVFQVGETDVYLLLEGIVSHKKGYDGKCGLLSAYKILTPAGGNILDFCPILESPVNC